MSLPRYTSIGRGWWDEWLWTRPIPPSMSRWAKATWSRPTSYPQFDPQCSESTVRPPAWARSASWSAACRERLGSRSTPARDGPAAHPGGMPDEPVPQETTLTRPPAGPAVPARRQAGAGQRVQGFGQAAAPEVQHVVVCQRADVRPGHGQAADVGRVHPVVDLL